MTTRGKETILYKKKGSRYVEWGVGFDHPDSYPIDSYPIGAHLLVVHNSCGAHVTSYRHNINPDFGPILAATRFSSEKIAQIIAKASMARPREEPVTPEQTAAWEQLREAYGGGPFYLQYPSYNEIAMRIVEEMISLASEHGPSNTPRDTLK